MISELPYPIVSADGHMHEPPELYERLPTRLRERVEFGSEPVDGGAAVKMLGVEFFAPAFGRTPTADELTREFREDPTGGRDPLTRLRHQAQDGVTAEVVFPNTLLALGAIADGELNLALARAYNDYVHETFASFSDRIVAVPLVPVDNITAALAEAKRCIEMGFKTLMLPCSAPWMPYDRPEYEPLWSLVEEAGIPLNFHVFTGNVFLGTDFASVEHMAPEDFSSRTRSGGGLRERRERLSTTVIGMAAGMGPIVHLTGGGVLERHPNLKFVVTEAECGWLAWTLHAMDTMQARRRLGLDDLSLKPSEYFRRQGAVTISDDPIALRNLPFTGADNIMWGNDYPHDEGTYPSSRKYREEILRVAGPADAHKIFVGNAARIYGFDEARLRAVA